jgi:hypothetical protein
MSKYKEALESMVWQFGYRGISDGKSAICNGGLSALEEAFEALGWDNPHYIEDINGCICDVEGCAGWVVSQGCAWEETGYWMVCREHSEDSRNNKLQPKMKQRAIDREASRDSRGYLPM